MLTVEIRIMYFPTILLGFRILQPPLVLGIRIRYEHVTARMMTIEIKVMHVTVFKILHQLFVSDIRMRYKDGTNVCKCFPTILFEILHLP